MNHQERWTACRADTKRLLKTYPHDVLATGVTGSVGRGSDMRFSDIDFHVLVRKNSKLRSHRFVLRGSLFSVASRTEKDWLDELAQPNHALPLVVGSLKSMRAIHDPPGHFRRLRKRSETLSSKIWNNAVRTGLEEIVEDLGRVRNAYTVEDWKNFQLHSPHVAVEAGLVHSSLRRRAILTEKHLLNAQLQGYGSRFGHAILVGAGMMVAKPKEALDSLKWMYSTLSAQAVKQGAAPVSYDSATSYVPP